MPQTSENALTLDALQAERDMLLQQVTADLEELSFLREIAALLTITEFTWDIGDVARAMLPRLQHCTGAQQIVLLATDHGTAAAAPGHILAHAGEHIVDTAWCRRLATQFASKAKDRPFVLNTASAHIDGADAIGLRSLVLIGLVHADQIYGWLLAINRASSGWDDPGEGQASDNLFEFGTRQATLISSAASILATHASNIELFRAKERLFTDLVRGLVRAIEAKDRYTCGHSERVARYGQLLAETMGLSPNDCQRTYLAGLLHDIGKINVNESILQNSKRLSDAEFAEMKKHPEHGWGILQGLEGLQNVLNGVVYHHEQWDGSGYPDGLAGQAIPIDSRILAVADAFDAMTSDRPYRQSMPIERATAILENGAGSQWDPAIVKLLLNHLPQILEIRNTHQLREPPTRKKMTVECLTDGHETATNANGSNPEVTVGTIAEDCLQDALP